jgi:hypothetical protein
MRGCIAVMGGIEERMLHNSIDGGTQMLRLNKEIDQIKSIRACEKTNNRKQRGSAISIRFCPFLLLLLLLLPCLFVRLFVCSFLCVVPYSVCCKWLLVPDFSLAA